MHVCMPHPPACIHTYARTNRESAQSKTRLHVCTLHCVACTGCVSSSHLVTMPGGVTEEAAPPPNSSLWEWLTAPATVSSLLCFHCMQCTKEKIKHMQECCICLRWLTLQCVNSKHTLAGAQQLVRVDDVPASAGELHGQRHARCVPCEC